MASLQYNQGGTTSTIGEQLTEFEMARFVILASRQEKIFSQLGEKHKIPRHHGTKIKAYRRLPILHDDNVNGQGIDFNGVTMEAGFWYSWDANNVRQQHNTEAEALARVGMVKYMKGDGNLWGSSKDFNRQAGAFPVLREIGGVVNQVGIKRIVIEGEIQRFSISASYTRIETELDTEKNIVGTLLNELSETYAEIRETQVQHDLITAGLQNVTYTGNATSLDELDETCQLTLTDLRKLEIDCNDARIPFNTKVLVGNTKIDTAVVPKARYIYCSNKFLPTLEDMTHNGRFVFVSYEHYAGKDNSTYMNKAGKALESLSGEMGKIGNFRFIGVQDMTKFAGAGADATDGVDANADGIEDAGENMYHTNGHYDAFVMLVVGDRSFMSLGLQGYQDVRVHHARPTAIAGLDQTADNGSIALEWWHGVLITRPERIRMIATALRVA